MPVRMAAAAVTPGPRYDPRSLEIKTKSIEQTLVPLVSQISALLNFNEKYASRLKSEKAAKTMMKVGSSVQSAVERFVTVGETIADENPDIQPEMYDACSEARAAGQAIARLSSNPSSSENQDKHVLVRSSRQLLSSVTRVLLLADRVLVKNILKAEDKVAFSLMRLENSVHFTDFVKTFSEFGQQMVDLAHKTGDRQHDVKSDKRRAQMQVARAVLEKYTMLLLTASKTYLRHPDCESARQARDGVFRRMRTALQLIGLCVCDGVLPFDPVRYQAPGSAVANHYPTGATGHAPNSAAAAAAIAVAQQEEEPLDIGLQLTANVAIRQLMESLEMVRVTGGMAPGVRDRLSVALDSVCEMSQDFTDSAYTAHHHREQILDLIEETRFGLSGLLKPDMDREKLAMESIESTISRVSSTLKDLQKQLQIVAMDQIGDVFRENEDHVILSSIKTCSVSGDIDGVEQFIDQFREHSDHMQEVCRLLHHISMTDSLHVTTGHAERNLRSLAPLVILAGRTLSLHPSSRIARENLEVFCNTWAECVNELSALAKEADAAVHGRVAVERQAYMSLPKPGKHGKTPKPVKPVSLDVDGQQELAKVGLDMKMITLEVDAEAEKWDEYAENDIVRRAKNMTSMAYNMYLFTRGDGPLKTTHDLFTQAEFFAEEANKMYKSVREFAYEVPGSAEKNELMTYLEKIPQHCQQLQVLVKSPTVGKAATFTKVDNVIGETKNLMNQISKLVTHCFVAATKYDIEFRSASMGPGGGSGRSADGEESRPMGGDASPWRRSVSRRSNTPHHKSVECV